MSFLFDISSNLINNNKNTTSIFKDPYSGNKYTVRFKNQNTNSNTNYIKNTIKKSVYNTGLSSGKEENQYKKLISDMNGSMDLSAADFCYLKDLGRYPLNKLIILRRFQEGVIVPNNLNTFNKKDSPKPLATLIGWVSEEDENIFDMSFSEGWDVYTDSLHNLLHRIIKDEFHTDMAKIIPVNKWAQGILFGFLNKVGLTKDFDYNNIPQGNPNVLQEGAKRKGGGFDNQYSLNSEMNLKLNTAYIQRSIGDIDPGSAMLDIINNIVRLGTSDVNYVYNSSNSYMRDLINSSYSTDPDVWGHLMLKYAKAMVKSVSQLVSYAYNKVSKDLDKIKLEKEAGPPAKVEKSAEERAKELFDKGKDALIEAGKVALDAIKKLGTAISVSTIRKYRWEMIGAIAAGTGINSTPWHLTIGNPYSPVVSLGNIVVDNINLKLGNSMSFNDLSSEINVEVNLKFGRNLGGQEIRKMFNNNYTRDYSKKPKADKKITKK